MPCHSYIGAHEILPVDYHCAVRWTPLREWGKIMSWLKAKSFANITWQDAGCKITLRICTLSKMHLIAQMYNIYNIHKYTYTLRAWIGPKKNQAWPDLSHAEPVHVVFEPGLAHINCNYEPKLDLNLTFFFNTWAVITDALKLHVALKLHNQWCR